MNVDRVREMEYLLDKCMPAIEGLERELNRMDKLGDDMKRLFDYYGSDAWYEDRDGELPDGIKAGVLSEDSVYDAITGVRDAAIRMIELAADILKNRI